MSRVFTSFKNCIFANILKFIMRHFKVVTNLSGWTVFIIALVVYYFTLEPTASWWDCSEFIISAYKLEVGHPPGAPLFMILGRFFTLFAGDVSQVAFMVNLLSAFAGAGTVMFLFFTVVLIAKKFFPGSELTNSEQFIVVGSGLVGSLAFAFTDSFWFSAVKGEVYALSSFFTAAVFWAVLKWESEADLKYASRWLILIAYLTGLSIGVHLLNLLAIPAIGLVLYFRKYEFSVQGMFLSLILSLIILATVQYVIIPGVPWLVFLSDKLFVNEFGFPFNSGIIFFLAVVGAGLIWGVRYTGRRGLALWNTVISAVIVILMGYSTYAVIMIRADANPPMNQNHPNNAFALLRYLDREQYGNRPLVYGPYYNAPAIAVTGERKIYNRVDGRYKVTGTIAEKTLYEPKLQTVFPRMYSSQPQHIEAYKEWGRIRGTPVRIREDGQEKTVRKPSFAGNLRFFLTYQTGHMYFRYFLWNFAGRQNDEQGHGNFLSGNWISGINFLDEVHTGPSENLPCWRKNDPSRNTYYFLPLLFGLIGFFYQYNHGKKGKEGFAVILTLFLFTGIGIIVYLNQTPLQPRERDYSYLGSFYAFAIWIGLSVPALCAAVKTVIKNITGVVAVILMSLVLVPGILIAENMDDHDRSGRYMTRDYAVNYLESCAPNAILLTYGDNDTFPLWYVQEVEGVRPDIRIINISYLGMDWYINQHKQVTNEAPPIPFLFEKQQYYEGTRDIVIVQDRIEDSVSLEDAMMFLGSDDERSKLKLTNGQTLDYLPSKRFYLPVDKQKVIDNGTVQPEDSALIADTVELVVDREYIGKGEMAVLNIIAANNWERPVYIVNSLLYTGHIFFTDYLQVEGFAYRFVPIKSVTGDINSGHINTRLLYDNVMNKFVWGNVNDPDVYLDEYNKKTIKIMQTRQVFTRLSEALIDEGKNEMAVKVLNRLFELFPDEKIPLSTDSFRAAEQYLRAGEKGKGHEKLKQMASNSLALLKYYLTLPEYFARVVSEEEEREMSHLQNILVLTKEYKLDDLNREIDSELQKMIDRLSNNAGL
ncbi:MAG: DUF2723 domain-containing protein [Prolixibacteraceae bacterium]|nr:DUF2723 domain-containing protein [Prolixibacteraceae bacterium]